MDGFAFRRPAGGGADIRVSVDRDRNRTVLLFFPLHAVGAGGIPVSLESQAFAPVGAAVRIRGRLLFLEFVLGKAAIVGYISAHAIPVRQNSNPVSSPPGAPACVPAAVSAARPAAAVRQTENS